MPLSASVRHQWRIAAVLIALQLCRGGQATTEQLHTLVWALRDVEGAQILREVWDGSSRRSYVRGYVPGLLQTLRVGQIDGVIEQQSTGRQSLTDRGRDLIDRFRESEGTLGRQEAILAELAPFTAAGMWRRLGER